MPIYMREIIILNFYLQFYWLREFKGLGKDCKQLKAKVKLKPNFTTHNNHLNYVLLSPSYNKGHGVKKKILPKIIQLLSTKLISESQLSLSLKKELLCTMASEQHVITQTLWNPV